MFIVLRKSEAEIYIGTIQMLGVLKSLSNTFQIMEFINV